MTLRELKVFMKIGMIWIALLLALNVSAVETTLIDSQGTTNWLYTPKEKPDPAKRYWLVVGVHGVGGNGKEACGVAKWAEEFDERMDPHKRPYYWLTGVFQLNDTGEETDVWALENNYVSVVPVQFDMTAHHAIPLINNWKFNI